MDFQEAKKALKPNNRFKLSVLDKSVRKLAGLKVKNTYRSEKAITILSKYLFTYMACQPSVETSLNK